MFQAAVSKPQARSRISSEKRVYQASTANRNQRRGHPHRRNATQASARDWLSLYLPTFTRRKAICSGYPAPPVGTRKESTELPGSKSLTSTRRGAQDREDPAECVKGARDFNDYQFFETVSRNHGHLLEVFADSDRTGIFRDMAKAREWLGLTPVGPASDGKRPGGSSAQAQDAQSKPRRGKT